jgi:hypothetical protein
MRSVLLRAGMAGVLGIAGGLLAATGPAGGKDAVPTRPAALQAATLPAAAPVPAAAPAIPPTPPPPPAPAAAPPAATPCAPDALQAKELSAQAALGTAVVTYVLRDAGSAACNLASGPQAWAAALTGPTAAVTSVSLPPGGGDLPPGTTSVVHVYLDTALAAAGSLAHRAEPVVPPAGLPSPPAPPPASVPAPPSAIPPLPTLPAVPRLPATPPSLPAPPVPTTHQVVPAPPTTHPAVPAPPTTLPSAVYGIASEVHNAVDPPQSPPKQTPPKQTPPPAPSGPSYRPGDTGYDISWPQCGGAYPPQPYTVAVVGVNDGSAFTSNPCLASEARWAGSDLEIYLNINSPQSVDDNDTSGPAGNCSPGNTECIAYNYGYNTALQSLSYAAGQSASSPVAWLDVETAGQCSSSFPTGGNGYWSCNQQLNSSTIQGALDALRAHGEQAGVYSTSYQWSVITGGYTPSGGQMGAWVAGAQDNQSWCSGHGFGGGSTRLLQVYPPQTYDRDRAC